MVDAVGATSYAYGSAGTFLTEDGPWADDAMTIANDQLTAGSRSGTLTVAGTAASATQVTVNGQGAYLYSDKTWAVTGVPLATTNLTAVATDGAGHAATHTITLNPATALSPQYDPNGNLVSDGRRSFTYDTENQLVSVLVTNGPLDATLSGFVYDGLSRRRVRTEAVWRPTGWLTNEVLRYLYDGNRVIQERDGSNTVLVTYTRGLDISGTIEGAGGIGGFLARTHPGNHHFYYHSDANGNVTAIINQSTNLVAQYRYDPFGNLVAQTGPLAEGNLYRYSSKEFHQASGLYYYGYRFYDPNLQRWLNRDPLGEEGGINLYNIVKNDPINSIDPVGFLEAQPKSPVAVKLPMAPTFFFNWEANGLDPLTVSTVVCDGGGGFRIFLTKNVLEGNEIAKGCRIEHEQSHIEDYKKDKPDLCKNKPSGTHIYTRSTARLNQTEIKAYDKEIACIERQRDQFNATSPETADDYIKRLKKDRQPFETPIPLPTSSTYPPKPPKGGKQDSPPPIKTNSEYPHGS